MPGQVAVKASQFGQHNIQFLLSVLDAQRAFNKLTSRGYHYLLWNDSAHTNQQQQFDSKNRIKKAVEMQDIVGSGGHQMLQAFQFKLLFC